MSSMPDFNLGPEIAKTRRVVIVDGDRAMREMVARYFEEHSIPVSAVSNRAGLSRHLAVMNPCLILLEVRLGQDDGLDVLSVRLKTCGVVGIICVSKEAV
jgi:DNA-binding response OmpR family regulator